MKRYLFSLLLFPVCLFSQPDHYQYFDGADTSSYNSIIISIDTLNGNVWQVGKPQKNIFDSAATFPNAIVTDTINYYPINDSSYFEFYFDNSWWQFGILALQWKQKLDFEQGSDGGIIEFSLDKKQTWQNAFNNPYVYNFYGYNLSNAQLLTSNGVAAFTGTDSTWKDIWLCFSASFLQASADTTWFRYKIYSDSSNTQNEGWIIDNMILRLTIAHTIDEKKSEKYLNVYPSITNGKLNIETIKLQEFHIIESMQLVNIEGKTVEEFGVCPTKFWIDISHHPDGIYFLKVKTNKKTETVQISLKK